MSGRPTQFASKTGVGTTGIFLCSNAGVCAAYLDGEIIRADASVTALDKAIVLTDAGYERSPAGIERMCSAQVPI